MTKYVVRSSLGEFFSDNTIDNFGNEIQYDTYEEALKEIEALQGIFRDKEFVILLIA